MAVGASRDAEALKRTDTVQLAVFACDLAAFEVLMQVGLIHVSRHEEAS